MKSVKSVRAMLHNSPSLSIKGLKNSDYSIESSIHLLRNNIHKVRF